MKNFLAPIIFCSVILGLCFSFTILREREFAKELRKIKDVTSFSPTPTNFEGYFHAVDTKTSSLLFEELGRWFIGNTPRRLHIVVDQKTKIVARVPIYEENIIVGIQERQSSLENVPEGSHGFVKLRLQDDGSLIATEITYGDLPSGY